MTNLNETPELDEPLITQSNRFHCHFPSILQILSTFSSFPPSPDCPTHLQKNREEGTGAPLPSSALQLLVLNLFSKQIPELYQSTQLSAFGSLPCCPAHTSHDGEAFQASTGLSDFGPTEHEHQSHSSAKPVESMHVRDFLWLSSSLPIGSPDT